METHQSSDLCPAATSYATSIYLGSSLTVGMWPVKESNAAGSGVVVSRRVICLHWGELRLLGRQIFSDCALTSSTFIFVTKPLVRRTTQISGKFSFRKKLTLRQSPLDAPANHVKWICLWGVGFNDDAKLQPFERQLSRKGPQFGGSSAAQHYLWCVQVIWRQVIYSSSGHMSETEAEGKTITLLNQLHSLSGIIS